MIKPNWIAVTWETWKLVNEQKRIKPTHPAQRDEKYASFSEKKKKTLNFIEQKSWWISRGYHDVHVEPIGAKFEHALGLRCQIGEVRRQHRRCYFRGHTHFPKFTALFNHFSVWWARRHLNKSKKTELAQEGWWWVESWVNIRSESAYLLNGRWAELDCDR